MQKDLIIAIPKGRILKELQHLFLQIGFNPEADFYNENSRKLIFDSNFDNIKIIKVRSFDVATFVKFGGADLGVCGLDVLEEFSSPDIHPILDLEIGKCRLAIATSKPSSQRKLGSQDVGRDPSLRWDDKLFMRKSMINPMQFELLLILQLERGKESKKHNPVQLCGKNKLNLDCRHVHHRFLVLDLDEFCDRVQRQFELAHQLLLGLVRQMDLFLKFQLFGSEARNCLSHLLINQKLFELNR